MAKYNVSPKPAIVYKVTNIITGDFYIGCTCQSLKARLRNHYSHSKAGYPGRHMDAIRKYGWDNFKSEILDTADSRATGYEKERHYIALLKPQYNIANGGTGKGTPSRLKGIKLSEAHRLKIIESKKFDPEHPEKYQEFMDHLDSIRESCLEKTRKRTQCINDGKIFASAADAARYYNLSCSQIVTRVCRGVRKTVSKLRFKYIE